MNEQWKDVSGYEGLYQVSNLGNVKALEREVLGKDGKIYHYKERILKSFYNDTGYLHVALHKNGKRKTCKVHRLVAQAFIPNPNNLPIINHRDENKSNNLYTNLEWCDHKYNTNYGTRTERWREHNKDKHERQQKKVLNVTTGEIFNSLKEVEEKLEIPHSNVSKCCHGERKTAGGYEWQFVSLDKLKENFI